MASQKQHALDEISKAWQELKSVFDRVPRERIDEVGVVEQWSVKDLIGHVTTWESETMSLIGQFAESGNPEVLRIGDVDTFNERTTRSKRSSSVSDLLGDLDATHLKTVQFVSNLQEEMFDHERVEWRIRVDTFEHYREHAGHIRDWLDEVPSV